MNDVNTETIKQALQFGLSGEDIELIRNLTTSEVLFIKVHAELNAYGSHNPKTRAPRKDRGVSRKKEGASAS